MEQKLYCIGVGPGDPELLTLKALRILTEVDAIAYPYSDKGESEAVAFGIVKAACENVEQKDLIPIHVPMTRDSEVLEKAYREATLKESDALSDRKIMAVSNCGLKGEAIYEGVENIPDNAGYFTIVIAK